MSKVLLIHALATWALTGLIWTVQVVHYPLFALAGAERFGQFHRAHMWRMTALVGPLVLVEALTAALLCLQGSGGPGWWLSIGLLLVVWAVTWGVQVPLHFKLMGQGDPETVRRLVRSNWVRTAGWTSRAVLLAWLLM